MTTPPNVSEEVAQARRIDGLERMWNAGLIQEHPETSCDALGRAMFDLPSPARYRLDRPPLVLAMAQVRYDVHARLATLEGIAPVQDRIEEPFPYMQGVQEQELSFVLGPGGASVPPLGQPQQTWRFTDDAGWTLVVAPDSATVSMGSGYDSVDEMASRFHAVIDALAVGGRVRRCTRLGVRYINLAEFAPGDDTGWRTWFRPQFVGWVGDTVLTGQAVVSVAQTQVVESASGVLAESLGPVQGIIRHGVVPESSIIPGLSVPTAHRGYLIDVDLWVDGPQPLLAEDMSQQFLALHAEIDRFFRWTLADAGAEHFGLREEMQ